MRDPERIPEVIAALLIAWQEHPDMRLGQLMVNITRPKDGIVGPDLFYLEDDVLLDQLLEWVESSRDWSPR